jgi:hypothetical protein
MDTSRPRDIVVFGGGTATNSLVDVFENLRKGHNCALKYVIPISDNGGSSSELIRVFGGPGTLPLFYIRMCVRSDFSGHSTISMSPRQRTVSLETLCSFTTLACRRFEIYIVYNNVANTNELGIGDVRSMSHNFTHFNLYETPISCL